MAKNLTKGSHVGGVTNQAVTVLQSSKDPLLISRSPHARPRPSHCLFALIDKPGMEPLRSLSAPLCNFPSPQEAP